MSQSDETKSQYDAITHQIDREDELVNKRLTWTLTFNGFLFAALGFLPESKQSDAALFAALKAALPWMGMAVAIAGLLGVTAAYIQLLYLTKEWEGLRDSHPVRPFGKKPHPFWLGALPCLIPPVALIAGWAWLLRA